MTVGSSVDLNASWHRFRLLRNRDGEHTVLAACIDLLAVDGIGQNETPMKSSMASLDTTTLRFLKMPAWASAAETSELPAPCWSAFGAEMARILVKLRRLFTGKFDSINQ